MKPAAIGARMVAAIFDLVIISVVGWIISIPFMKFFDPQLILAQMQEKLNNGNLEPEEAQALLQAAVPMLLGLLVLILVLAAVTHAYYVYFESTSGQTPGKRALGLRVVNLQGGPITRGQAVYREMVRWYVDVMFVLPAFISMYSTPRRQRVGDVLAKTMVIEASTAPPPPVRVETRLPSAKSTLRP